MNLIWRGKKRKRESFLGCGFVPPRFLFLTNEKKDVNYMVSSAVRVKK